MSHRSLGLVLLAVALLAAGCDSGSAPPAASGSGQSASIAASNGDLSTDDSATTEPDSDTTGDDEAPTADPAHDASADSDAEPVDPATDKTPADDADVDAVDTDTVESDAVESDAVESDAVEGDSTTEPDDEESRTDEPDESEATTAEVASAEPLVDEPVEEHPDDNEHPADEDAPLKIDAADAAAGAPNAELFRDWPKPQAVVILSGEQDGYIEPCGCAGKENQKGGLSRRHTLFKDLSKRGWELVPLDMGGLVRRYGRQTEIKFHTAVDGLRKLKYQAVGFGPGDLKLPEGELISDAGEFVSANVGLLGLQSGLVARSKVIEAGGRKIGVTSILGTEAQKEINNESLEFAEATAALKEVVPQLKEQGCDFLVLLSHASKDESQALAREFPDFDVVLTAGGAAEPPSEPATIEGSDALLVEVGHKGMYVACLGLYDDPDQPVRFQLVPLDSRFADSPDMVRLMAAYQGQLEELGLAGLDVRAVAHPSGHQFVGSAKCGECHTQAHEVWANTTHAHALATLEKLNPPRNHDPECLSCHVTGWEPQRFVPFTSGFQALDKTPLLRDNGCENCHGPGSAHVAAETGEKKLSDADRDALRAEMRLTLDQADKKCSECHDLDNSPEYVAKGFEHFWPHVEHHGKD